MHVTVETVRHLLVSQCPQWSFLHLEAVSSAGTDNALFRLGGDLCVRVPRVEWAVPLIRKEATWLPTLRNQLPLAIPELAWLGEPEQDFPSPWAVYRWLQGRDASQKVPLEPLDKEQAANDLGSFVHALQRIDADAGPRAGEANFHRGVPLPRRDDLTRQGLMLIGDEFDEGTLAGLWQAALNAPVWTGASVWVHGDLHAGNLLTLGGTLSAVLDFGGLGVGDPAVDLMPAWTMFEGRSRKVYRQVTGADEATWARGLGWTLSVATIALAHYRDSNPFLASASRLALRSVLAQQS